MLRKRGLSGVVTTLIIILLVLVAVGVIWVVVKNLVEKGAEQVELGQFTLDLQIKSAQVQNGNVTVVVVKRNPGQGNFVGMNFVFSDGQNSETIRQNITLEELEEKSFTFTLTKISTSNLKSVSIAPIYELDSGKETQGNAAASFEFKKSGTGTGSAVSGGKFAELGFTGTGKQEYSISSQPVDIVKFSKAIVDPLDVLPGDNQTFTVYVSSPYGIVNVTSITELDNTVLNLDFVEISDGIYSASWIVNDTHNTEYRTKITAIDSQGNSNSITLTWTDSCQSAFTHGSDNILSVSCTTTASSIEGIDGGSLELATGVDITLATGSKIIFNQGKSIKITAAGASIISTSGGSFGNGYLFYYDTDNDRNAKNTTLIYSTSSSNTSAQVRGIYNGGTDPYDSNSSANLSATTYFTVSRGDGSYDYNGVSGEEKQYTTIGVKRTCTFGASCSQTTAGVVGYETSAPACGVSGTYYLTFGLACNLRIVDDCTSDLTTSEARTQPCR